MPVIIAPVLIGLVAVMATIVCMVLMQTASTWLRPIIKALTANHHNFFVKVLTAPVRLVAKGVLQIQHTVTASLSHYVGATLKPVTAWLNGLSVIVGETSLHISGLAKATYDALNILRHTTIPRLIKLAVDPVRVIAVRADKLSAATDRQIDAITADLGNLLGTAGIGVWSTLHNQLIGWAKAYDNLHDEVWRNLVPDIAALKAEVFQTIRAQIGAIAHDVGVVIPGQLFDLRARVKAVEDWIAGRFDIDLTALNALVAPIALAGSFALAVEAVAPFLFCKNTRGVASKLCGLDESLLAELLAGTLAFAVLMYPEEVAAIGETTLDALNPLIREIARI